MFLRRVFFIVCASLCVSSLYAQYRTNESVTVVTNVVETITTNDDASLTTNSQTFVATNAITNVTYSRYLSPAFVVYLGAPMIDVGLANTGALYLSLGFRYRILEWLGVRASVAYNVGNAFDAIGEAPLEPNAIIAALAEAAYYRHAGRVGFEHGVGVGFAYGTERRAPYGVIRLSPLAFYPTHDGAVVLEFFAPAIYFPLSDFDDFLRRPLRYLSVDVATVGLRF